MVKTIVIVLWIQDELSFDKYYKKAKQIYRVLHVPGPDKDVERLYGRSYGKGIG